MGRADRGSGVAVPPRDGVDHRTGGDASRGAAEVVASRPGHGLGPVMVEGGVEGDGGTGGIERRLYLQTWFSSSFPTGAYAFGHGLEAAIADGAVRDAASLGEWVGSVLAFGGGRGDAIVAAVVHRAVGRGDREAVDEANAVALAFVAGAERLAETTAQGRAFVDAVRADPAVALRLDRALPGASPVAGAASVRGEIAAGDATVAADRCVHERMPTALPVAVGAVAAACAVPLPDTLACQLQAFGANLVWIGARLLPLGQREALGEIALLRAPIARVVDSARAATLDDLGGCALLGDIASLRHERLATRLCLS